MQTTPNENRHLRWLQKAMPSDDERPLLLCVHVKGAVTVATDGFRAHFIQTPVGMIPVGVLDEKIVRLPRILIKDTEIEIKTQDGHYPDVSSLVPTTDPAFQICVNAKYLREALEGMGGAVTLRFRKPGDVIEVLGRAPDETKVYALVMPTREPVDISTWRPTHS